MTKVFKLTLLFLLITLASCNDRAYMDSVTEVYNDDAYVIVTDVKYRQKRKRATVSVNMYDENYIMSSSTKWRNVKNYISVGDTIRIKVYVIKDSNGRFLEYDYSLSEYKEKYIKE